MSKKAIIILCLAVSALTLLSIGVQGLLPHTFTRMDVTRIRSVYLPPMYDHIGNNINVPDVVIYDLSGTNRRFAATTFAWSYEGELNGATPQVEFETITPGKNLLASAAINGSYIEFVPITDQGRGTATITLSVGDSSRTIFIRVYDLSLRLIALEFDDGPSEFTEQIVRNLSEAGISASFYVTGRNFHDIAHKYVGVEIFPESAILIFVNGHHVGNHTYSHPWIVPHSGGFHYDFPQGQYKPWWQYTEKEVIWQVNRADEAIYEVLGIVPNFFAPPYYYEGHNSYVISTGKTLASRRFAIDIGDWSWETTKDDIVERILSAPRNSTLVLHDIYQKTADAIEAIVRSPLAQEIQFVTGYELDMILGR